MNSQTGKFIILTGVVIVVVGVLVYFFHNRLNWFGRLPGDIRIEKENFKFYFPVVTMLLLSLLLTLFVNIIGETVIVFVPGNPFLKAAYLQLSHIL